MMTLHGTLSVFRFELRRTITISRIAVWLLLTSFPIFIIAVVKYNEAHFLYDARQGPPRGVPDSAWGLILFGLIPEVITLFGLLLWATPVVQSELEGRTWIYLAVRPRGRINLLLGKYLTAVTWTAVAGWVSATICVQIAQPDEAMRLWLTMLALVGLACPAYGALYSLIGVLLHRRAMVIAVAYTLIFEFLVSLIPAVINKFTIQYRLRNLLVSFMGWREFLMEESSGAGGILLGNEPPWLHVLLLIGITIVLLLIAVQVIQRKEYATADEA